MVYRVRDWMMNPCIHREEQRGLQ